MLKVDNFLIIFSLEVGGKFIGWFGVITNVIVLPLCLVLLIGICVDKDLKFIREQLDSMDFLTMNMNEITDEKAIKHLREYFLVSLILVVIISSIYLVASVLLIRGTNNVSKIIIKIFPGSFKNNFILFQRNFRQISPAKNILAFLAVFSVFGLLVRLSVNSMINAVLYVYVFAVINSLWKKLREEGDAGNRVTDAQRFYPVVSSPKV